MHARRAVPAAARTPGCWSSCCRPPTSRACWSRPPTCGATQSPPLRRWTHHPQERLLAGLGRAARLYPDLDDALRERPPGRAGARHRGRAPVPQPRRRCSSEAGYGVLLPAWWRRRPEPRADPDGAQPRRPIAPVLRDETADLGAHRRLPLGAGARRPDADRGRAGRPGPGQGAAGPAARAAGSTSTRSGSPPGWRSCAAAAGTMTAGEALRLIRLLPPEELPLPVTARRRRGLAGRPAGRAASTSGSSCSTRPRGWPAVLRPYQRRGLSWLAFLDGLGLGACLADDMGLGKTVQLLALLLHRRGPGPAAADLPAVGARQLAARGRAVRAGAAGAGAARRRPADRPRCRRRRPGADHLRDRHPRRRRARRGRAGTGWCSTRRSTSRTAPARPPGRCAGSRPGTGSR